MPLTTVQIYPSRVQRGGGSIIINADGSISIAGGQMLFPAGTDTLPSIALTGTTNLGIRFSTTLVVIVTGGQGRMSVSSSQTHMGANTIGWAANIDTTADLVILRQAADILAQRRAANVQELQVYENFVSATDYGRLVLRTAAGDYLISPEAAVETLRGLQVVASGGRLGFYGVTAVARAAAISAPTGGATVDSEARTAINSIRTALTNIGVTS